jgi:hypothetical protein
MTCFSSCRIGSVSVAARERLDNRTVSDTISVSRTRLWACKKVTESFFEEEEFVWRRHKGGSSRQCGL